jgi:hypothetical protein
VPELSKLYAYAENKARSEYQNDRRPAPGYGVHLLVKIVKPVIETHFSASQNKNGNCPKQLPSTTKQHNE